MKIAIVGAGPAGLACAWQLVKLGHEITVFERRSNRDAQGSGVLIQPAGLAALQAMGLRDKVELMGQKISRIEGFSGGDHRYKIISADYSLLNGRYDYALGVNRNALWSLLFNNVSAAGVSIKWQCQVVSMQRLENKSRLLDSDGNWSEKVDLVIDASGSGSPLRRYSTSTAACQTLKYGSLWAKVALPSNSSFDVSVMNAFSDAKNRGVGVMPIGRHAVGQPSMVALFFNLDWRECPDWTDQTFLTWKSNIAQSWPYIEPLLDQITSHEQLYLAKFRHQTMRVPYGDGIIFAGDAAHCSSPQLGQGINMSLIDAVVLAQALGNDAEIKVAAKYYAQARRNHVRVYQTLAKLLTPFYQSDNVLAINIRNHFFKFFWRMQSMKFVTTYLLSGRVCDPLKRVK